MSIKVRVKYTVLFHMPNNCVCCNDIHPSEKIQAQRSNIVSSARLEFPICKKCKSLIRTQWGSCIAILLSLISPILVILIYHNLYENGKVQNPYPANIIVAILSGIVVYFLVYFLSMAITQKGLGSDEIIRIKRARNAVKIVSYISGFYVTFRFENEAYGKAFSLMNNGTIIGYS